VSTDEMRRFSGIMLLSGYHSLPQQHLYWSLDEDIAVPIVRNAMTKNKFMAIKQNLHLCNNETLAPNDKLAKVRPMYDTLNLNLKQFDVGMYPLPL